jgi:hypothetical protein
MLLGLYLATNFNQDQSAGMRLFPGGGESRSARMSDLMQRCLYQHEEEVLAMGYSSIEEIGLHSIRKGVSTYLASLPGGPPPAALCLRAGWSMGQVKDIYFHQSQGGDEFTGRCAAMLNLMNGEFVTSPAFFKDSISRDAVKKAIDMVFPHHKNCSGIERVLEHCLASMVHHSEKMAGLAATHPAKNMPLHRNAELLAQLAPHITVVSAWDCQQPMTGIPPHIKSLVDISGIKEEQSKLVEKVTEKVMKEMKGYFETRRIGGGELTEARMREMIDQSVAKSVADTVGNPIEALEKRIDNMQLAPAGNNIDDDFVGLADDVIGNIEEEQQSTTATGDTGPPARATTIKYNAYFHSGAMTRLPKDWRFPTGGLYDLWLQWNLPDTNANRPIPPMREMRKEDYNWLDNVPKSPQEMMLAPGNKKGKPPSTKRRETRKTMGDVRFICNMIEDMAVKKGFVTTPRTLDNMQRMYKAVQDDVLVVVESSERQAQLKWGTVVRQWRYKISAENKAKKAAKEAAAAAENT